MRLFPQAPSQEDAFRIPVEVSTAGNHNLLSYCFGFEVLVVHVTW